MTTQVQTIIDSVREHNKTIYFLGCSGIGLSALMQYFNESGFTVSGSCDGASPVTEMLEHKGISVHTQHSADYITDEIGCVFYTVAIPEDHPELIAIQQKGIPLFTYSQGLGYISQNKKTIAVAGTHGKTSTTAMIAKVLIDAGLSPTVIVGSLLSAGGSNYVAGNGEWFLVEACEYHRSFHDIHPTIAVVTNIDNDHLDYYGDMNQLIAAFKKFGSSATDGVVTHTSGEYIAEAFDGLVVYDGDTIAIDRPLRVPGNHMRANAQLAVQVVHMIGIDYETAMASLADFAGTWRRSEFLGATEGRAQVYDDYGHHPTEIAVTLAGFKDRFSNMRMNVIFQPHLYSRTKLLFAEFVDSLAIADRVFVAPIYAAREVDPGDISSVMIVDALRERGVDAYTYNRDVTTLPIFDESDLVITLGAGELYKDAHAILALSSTN
jgi:UDP-N-acetylmuramate--alanine ligase